MQKHLWTFTLTDVHLSRNTTNRLVVLYDAWESGSSTTSASLHPPCPGCTKYLEIAESFLHTSLPFRAHAWKARGRESSGGEETPGAGQSEHLKMGAKEAGRKAANADRPKQESFLKLKVVRVANLPQDATVLHGSNSENLYPSDPQSDP